MEGSSKGEEKPATELKRCLIRKKISLMERYLILMCFSLFIAFLVMIGITVHWKRSHHHPPVCESDICHSEAGQILSKIDISVDPCEDFHSFACGSFAKYRKIPEGEDGAYFDIRQNALISLKEALESDDELGEPDFVRKVKLFYRSCLNRPTQTGEIIREYLNISKFNVWPLCVLEQGYVPPLEERLATATILGMQNPYFGMIPNYEDKLITVGSARPVIPNEILFGSHEQSEETMRIYKFVLAYVLYSVGTSWEEINMEINELVEFQKKLAKIPTKEEPVNVNTTLTEMEGYCPLMKWTLIWKSFYNYYGRPDDYNEEYTVRVDSITFIKELCKFLEESDPRIVHDYLVWTVLRQHLIILDDHYRYILPRGPNKEGYNKSYLSEWKFCIYKLKAGKMNPGIEYLTIKRLNRENLIKEAKIYAEELKTVMGTVLTSQSWIDSNSKDKAMTKLRSLDFSIGYTNSSTDEDSLSKFYESIDVTESYVENMLLDGKYRYRYRLFGGIKPFDLERISQINAVPRAMYYEFGKIDITFVLLSSPFLVLGTPRYLNYGGFGTLFSHELNHAFDAIGEDKYNEEKGNFWANSTIKTFREKRQCLIDQYSKFSIGNNGKKVDGLITKRENIADNSGLLLTLKAYDQFLLKHDEEPRLPGLDFTNLQMFFIRFAQLNCNSLLNYRNDTHSPDKYRTNGPLQNSERFSEEFHCPVGSPMNPKHKCKIWE